MDMPAPPIAPDAPPTPALMRQDPIPSPASVVSGRALVAHLIAQGMPPEEAKARVRALIAQQQAGGAGGAAGHPR